MVKREKKNNKMAKRKKRDNKMGKRKRTDNKTILLSVFFRLVILL
jgi:hypothetical protein